VLGLGLGVRVRGESSRCRVLCVIVIGGGLCKKTWLSISIQGARVRSIFVPHTVVEYQHTVIGISTILGFKKKETAGSTYYLLCFEWMSTKY
jgi:hypothetical protein